MSKPDIITSRENKKYVEILMKIETKKYSMIVRLVGHRRNTSIICIALLGLEKPMIMPIMKQFSNVNIQTRKTMQISMDEIFAIAVRFLPKYDTLKI